MASLTPEGVDTDEQTLAEKRRDLHCQNSFACGQFGKKRNFVSGDLKKLQCFELTNTPKINP